jgi:hypothetical protein
MKKTRQAHRLHYHWTQLEADRAGLNAGSPLRPLPHTDRILHLQQDREYREMPLSTYWECPSEQVQFKNVADIYKTSDYNTFTKDGALKLTEVELYWLCSQMTRASSSEWGLVYLGLGNGQRFRWLRDDFFPGLSVIGFDPFEGTHCYIADQAVALRNAEVWNNDGTNFRFYVRTFDVDNDIALIHEKMKGKKLLLISDIRGMALRQNGTTFDKGHDQDLQWKAIQRLRPVSSLLKFDSPYPYQQFFYYPPGVILKQVFSNFRTSEVRLVVDGVPQEVIKYNGWELKEQMMLHHKYLRGQVYETSRKLHCTRCFDCCFDCTVLWETVSTYAARNNVDPYKMLDIITQSHLHSW